MTKLAFGLFAFVACALTAPLVQAQEPEPFEEFLTYDSPFLGRFGNRLAASETTLVVSSLAYLHVFELSQAGELELRGQLPIPGVLQFENELLDAGLALDGDRIVVGHSVEQRIFIFEKSNQDWGLAGEIEPPILWQLGFGHELALDGTRLALSQVVAFTAGSSNAPPGRAWVTELGSSALTLTPILPSVSSAGDGFGMSLALEGDMLVIGAPNSPIAGPAPGLEGRVFVFQRSASGTWNETQVFESSLAVTRGIGRGVQLSGGKLALLDTEIIAGVPYPGASIYELNGGTWTFVSRAVPNNSANDIVEFASFDFDGDRVVFRSHPIGDQSLIAESRSSAGIWSTESRVLQLDVNSSALEVEPIVYWGDMIVAGDRNPVSGINGSGINDSGIVRAWESRPRNLVRFCEGSRGCDACPCGNSPSGLGGCLNVQSRSGSIVSVGRAQVANGNFGIEARGLTSGTFALLMNGSQALLAPSTGCVGGGSFATGFGVPFAISNGLRCAGGVTRRLGIRRADANGDIGAMTAGWGASDSPSTDFSGSFVAGQRQVLQIVYRDSAAFGCSGSLNTTDALSVTFAP